MPKHLLEVLIEQQALPEEYPLIFLIQEDLQQDFLQSFLTLDELLPLLDQAERGYDGGNVVNQLGIGDGELLDGLGTSLGQPILQQDRQALRFLVDYGPQKLHAIGKDGDPKEFRVLVYQTERFQKPLGDVLAPRVSRVGVLDTDPQQQKGRADHLYQISDQVLTLSLYSNRVLILSVLRLTLLLL